MGDLSETSEWKKKGKFRHYFPTLARRHNSPISQVFLDPFTKPTVVISDYREVNDILSRRDAVDVKRGKKTHVFAGILPHSFTAMETYDPRFKPCRDLTRNLMTPSFLNKVGPSPSPWLGILRTDYAQVNAPRIHAVVLDLIRLWRLKAQLAGDRYFDVSSDIHEFPFDAILTAALGLDPEGGDIARQLAFLSETQHPDFFVDAPPKTPIKIPSLPISPSPSPTPSTSPGHASTTHSTYAAPPSARLGTPPSHTSPRASPPRIRNPIRSRLYCST